MTKLAYFDHNILNQMVRGAETRIMAELRRDNLLPVYSDANLDEIELSAVRKDQFLDLLTRMGAWHLSTPLDEEFTTTDQFVAANKRPRERLLELQDARAGYESMGRNLDFLSLMYGGGGGKLPSEILLAGIGEAEDIFKAQVADPDLNLPELAHLKKQAIDGLAKIKGIQEQIRDGCREIDERAKRGPLTEQAAEEIGIGPKQLNNIEMPGAIDKVWSLVGPHYGPSCASMDDFLTMTHSLNQVGLKALPAIVNSANGLYNLLNLFGYYRDEGLRKGRRMRASFSDMTHVGYAIACNRFYCDDQRLGMKAVAIYAHLGIEVELRSS